MRALGLKPGKVQGVWYFAPLWWRWFRGYPVGNRDALISWLTARFPFHALYLSERASDHQPGWRVFSGDTDFAPFEYDMDLGVWAHLFLSRNPGDTLPAHGPRMFPKEGEAVREIRNLGAGAGIWSWEDNNDWLITVTEDASG